MRVAIVLGCVVLGCSGAAERNDEAAAPEPSSPDDLGPCEMQPGQYELGLTLRSGAVCTPDPVVYACTPGEPLECPPGPDLRMQTFRFAGGDDLGALAKSGACDPSPDGCSVSCIGAQWTGSTIFLEVEVERDSATSASGTTHLDGPRDLSPCEYDLTLTLMR